MILEQRNPYLGKTPRPWLSIPFRNAEGIVVDLKLIADTGCVQALILAPEWFDALVLYRFDSIRNNFGTMDGGWLQIFDPQRGFVDRSKAYSSARVAEMVAQSHPDFAGLVGLPILRLGEYGGDATEFWFRYPVPERESNMRWEDRISSKPDVCHGKVCIAGTRIPVTVVLDNLAEGASEAEILDEYPTLVVEDIRAAMHYAAGLASGRVIILPEAA